MDTAASAAADDARLRVTGHDAVVAESPRLRARLVAEQVHAALDAGHIVAASVDATQRAALRESIGPAFDDVELLDPAQLHAAPAFTVALRIARMGRRAATAGSRALMLSQPHDLPWCPAGHWPRLEIALNVALPGLPMDVLCLYDSAAADPTLAADTHPVVTTADGSGASNRYRSPGDALVEFPPPPPPDLGPPVALLAFADDELGSVRDLVGQVAQSAGFDDERVQDLVLSVSELATNSVEHGGGAGELRLWRRDGDPPAVTAEVFDRGGGMISPFPGLALPAPDGARGRGLWLASELCDVLQVWSDDSSTVVRVTAGPEFG